MAVKTIPMPLLNRIMAATRWVERRMRNNPSRRGRWQGRQRPEKWIRFELKEDLFSGVAASADILDTSGARTGEFKNVIDVVMGFTGQGYDETGAGSGSGLGAGEKGWARWCRDSNRYEVKQLTCDYAEPTAGSGS